jgi:hypothetical protein
MWTYQVDGHEFIGINAPGLSTTWSMTRRCSSGTSGPSGTMAGSPAGPRRASTNVCFVNGAQYAGDASGNLYKIDPSLPERHRSVGARADLAAHGLPSMEPITFAAWSWPAAPATAGA